MFFSGDLIVQMQEFVQMVGWTKNMVDLITCKEGSFKTVSTNCHCHKSCNFRFHTCFVWNLKMLNDFEKYHS